MFKQLLKEIKAHDRIIIYRHWRPDCDAMGSQIGLYNIIKDNFPKKEVYKIGDESERYAFMQGSEMDVIPDGYFEGALAVLLDCGSARMVSDERYKTAHKSIRVDHHLPCEQVADIEIVDPTFESCCGMIAAFAKECKLKLSLVAATSLYTGMVTDSGRFRFDSTSARTFTLAAYLLESQPINLNELNYNLYAEDFDTILQKAQNMQKIRFTPQNVAYIYNTREELAMPDGQPPKSTYGMVSLMSDIKGVFIWANFTENDLGVQVELRSNRFNINPIAVKYGGGGHKKASGCLVPDRATVEALLADLDELVKSGKFE